MNSDLVRAAGHRPEGDQSRAAARRPRFRDDGEYRFRRSPATWAGSSALGPLRRNGTIPDACRGGRRAGHESYVTAHETSLRLEGYGATDSVSAHREEDNSAHVRIESCEHVKIRHGRPELTGGGVQD